MLAVPATSRVNDMECLRMPDRFAMCLLIPALCASLGVWMNATANRAAAMAGSGLEAMALVQAQPIPAPASVVAPELQEAEAWPASQRERRIASFIASRYAIMQSEALQFVRIAGRAAARSDLDPVLLLAMMAVESGFRHEAVSSAGAKGLMQIIPEFHPEKFEHPGLVFDPEHNIQTGARILREYLGQLGSLQAALQRYAGASADTRLLYARRVHEEIDRINAAIEPPGHQAGISLSPS